MMCMVVSDNDVSLVRCCIWCLDGRVSHLLQCRESVVVWKR